jgi:hypothetical protein
MSAKVGWDEVRHHYHSLNQEGTLNLEHTHHQSLKPKSQLRAERELMQSVLSIVSISNAYSASKSLSSLTTIPGIIHNNKTP